MTDEELAEKVGRALYIERPLELDQEGGDDWAILPDEWREEWREGARAALEGALALLPESAESEHGG